MQQRVFGGCHLTRDPILLLESAGFGQLDVQTGYISEFAAHAAVDVRLQRIGTLSAADNTAHVALLRGINVGGRNKVPMKDLLACVDAGDDYADVVTYIQSGNVVFTTENTDLRAMEIDLEQRIEESLRIPCAGGRPKPCRDDRDGRIRTRVVRRAGPPL